jgi:hypothetical protein
MEYSRMTRIFMDVGAHTGETAEIVLGKKYHFDRVCCFEPALECHPSLNKIALLDSRLEVYRYGLSVILPFLTGIGSRVHAAMANRCFGVIPPKAMFGRS